MEKFFKGFNKDLKCRNFQYEIGKEYEEKSASLCSSGFHACENPLDVFGYYPPADSRYCEVEMDGLSDQRDFDSKRCARKIKIGAEINLPGIIKAGVEFILDKVDWNNAKEFNTGNRSASTNTGHRSASTNTGYQSASTNTGYRSASTNTGNQSASTNTGNRSASTNTGDWSVSTVEGKESVAMAIGYESRARGALGCWIVLSEWAQTSGEYHIIDVQSAKVDGGQIKAGIFYMLKDGKFIEVSE